MEVVISKNAEKQKRHIAGRASITATTMKEIKSVEWRRNVKLITCKKTSSDTSHFQCSRRVDVHLSCSKGWLCLSFYLLLLHEIKLHTEDDFRKKKSKPDNISSLKRRLKTAVKVFLYSSASDRVSLSAAEHRWLISTHTNRKHCSVTNWGHQQEVLVRGSVDCVSLACWWSWSGPSCATSRPQEATRRSLWRTTHFHHHFYLCVSWV